MPMYLTFYFLQKSIDKPAFTPSISAVFPSEKGYSSRKLSLVTIDRADKQSDISHLDCYSNLQGSKVSSNMFLNSKSQKKEEVPSPASPVNLLTTTSSKESVLSEGWEKESNGSAFPIFSPCTSPVTFSHTVSPCSSVRSGAFTPSIMRFKYHSLAPGFSLVQMPPTSCQTLGCGSRAASPCPLSGYGRHRLPPTHLSLLTAILRKGRLPILSSAKQRPYSPCWPVSPINRSSCAGCSAASALPPIVDFQKDASIYPSHKTKPQLSSETLKMSPKQQKHIFATPLVESSGVIDSFSFGTSTVFSPNDEACCLNKPSESESPPSHSSKETYKDYCVPTVPRFSVFKSSFRPTCFQKTPSSFHHTAESEPPHGALSEHSTSPYSEYSKELYCPINSSGQENGQKSYVKYDPKSANQHNASAIMKQADEKTSSNLQYDKKMASELEQVISTSAGFRNSPFPTISEAMFLAYTPPISPAWTSPRSGTSSSTTDHYTLPTSSASPEHFLLSSPSYSLCSSPASLTRDDSPDCTEKNRKVLSSVAYILHS